MIPPVSSALLATNPSLCNLYAHLTAHVLASGGSTRVKHAEHNTIKHKLDEARIAVVKDEILLRILEEVGSQSPADLAVLVGGITAYVASSLEVETGSDVRVDVDELMRGDIAEFRAHEPQILHAVSTHLLEVKRRLTSTARDLGVVDILGGNHDGRVDVHRTLGVPLATALEHNETLSLRQNKQLINSIRDLELMTHGVESRHTAARSSYLVAVAKAMSLKVEIAKLDAEKGIYGDVEVMEVLENEIRRLDQEGGELERRENELQDVLMEYEVAGGESTFAAIGQRYREVEEEINVVKADIAKLEKQKLSRDR
ncbi:hypothetical protein LTR66_016647 [Elasticomyces elasticus]|nr:hypothetical protein LTR66_016647 [Elasticomyces elasticus]